MHKINIIFILRGLQIQHAQFIAGLQSFPGDLKHNDAAAMLQLVEHTREANEAECFVIGNQHGRHDVT